MGYFDNLKIDKWFKAITYLGGIIFISALLFPIQITSNKIIGLFGAGLFFYGTGYWKNVKTKTQFVPGGKLSWEERNTDIIGIILELSGILSMLYSIGLIIV